MNFQHYTQVSIRYRKKCQILAAIDLIWRVSDFFVASVSLLFQKQGHKSRITEDQNVMSYNVIKVMDDRVYDFLLSPFLKLLYFLGFFLQVASSIFLCKSCNGKSLPDNERASCKVWSRIALVSIMIVFIRFFLPYVILSISNLTYTVLRVLFKICGIYIVLKHLKEMDKMVLIDEEREDSVNYGRSRLTGSSSGASRSQSQSEEGHIPLEKGVQKQSISTTFNQSNSKVSELSNENQQSYVRPRVHRAMLHVEKEMYEQALSELQIAQTYAPEDVHIQVLLKTVEKIVGIANSKSKDYYKILGVSKTLSLDEIKRAYRRKSLRHHPDKHFTASDKVKTMETKVYQEIREAYDTLSDPIKRPAYDEKIQHDQQLLREYRHILKNVYVSFDSQYLSSIV